jgi:hypothetical protein
MRFLMGMPKIWILKKPLNFFHEIKDREELGRVAPFTASVGAIGKGEQILVKLVKSE